MGLGNDEFTVCDKPIARLLMSGTRIRFCQRCNLLLWQHCIRGQYTRNEAGIMNQRELARQMYLVRPDGTPWSHEWNSVVLPKIQRALEYRASQLIGQGVPDGKRSIVTIVAGVAVWPDWARGFLHAEWNASDFSEKTGRRLLAQMGSIKAGHLTDTFQHSLPPPPHSPSPLFPSSPQHRPRIESWLSELSIDDYLDEPIFPRDSASCMEASPQLVSSPPPLLPLRAAALASTTHLQRGSATSSPTDRQVPETQTATEPSDKPAAAEAAAAAELEGSRAERTGSVATFRELELTLHPELSLLSIDELKDLINQGLEDLLSAHLAVWSFKLRALAAAKQEHYDKATNMRQLVSEVAAARVAKARQLAIVDREFDLRFYDQYVAPEPAIRDVLLSQGITRAPIWWSGKGWHNFVWKDLEMKENQAGFVDWPGWNTSA